MIVTVKKMWTSDSGETVHLSLELREGEEAETRELVITMEQYTELAPRRGEIPQALFDELEDAAAVTDAVRRGLSILSYGANSVKALEIKLRQRGVSADRAGRAASYLEAKGYVREEEDALRETERDLRKGWGKTRILAHLKEKGYGHDAMAAVERRLRGVDFNKACADALRAKTKGCLPDTREEREKLRGALFRLGFSLSEIKFAFDVNSVQKES